MAATASQLWGTAEFQHAANSIHKEDELLLRARELRASTEPNSVVLTSDTEPVITFYSERHTIRGVLNDDVLERTKTLAASVFPGAPIYMAIARSADSDSRYGAVSVRRNFSKAIERYAIRHQTPELTVLLLR
jgi:hypothetical protein